jgi:hypothetical protein
MKQIRGNLLVPLVVLVPEKSTPLVGQVMRSNYSKEDLLDGNDDTAIEKSTDRSGGAVDSQDIQQGVR